MEDKEECYDCQYEERKNEIGPNKEAFNLAMCGNTVSLKPCSKCGARTGVLPYSDMNRAIRASNNEFIHPAEWD